MQILCLNKSSAVHPNNLSSLNLSLVLFFFFYAFAVVDKKTAKFGLKCVQNTHNSQHFKSLQQTKYEHNSNLILTVKQIAAINRHLQRLLQSNNVSLFQCKHFGINKIIASP